MVNTVHFVLLSWRIKLYCETAVILLSPLIAIIYCFLFGLLHGIIPDEHTWPITFSYAIGSASGMQGLRAALYFSAAFTFQRMLLSELSYLALAPFLLSPEIKASVYVLVGLIMSIAGGMVLKRNRYPHLPSLHSGRSEYRPSDNAPQIHSPPPRWALVHGFVAGFGLGGLSLFVNTVAAPAMPNAWAGFLPGLFFGLGTMSMLAAIGWLFGVSFHLWKQSLTEYEIRMIGAKTGGRTLFFGGFIFVAFGLFLLLNPAPLPGFLLITVFLLGIAVPSLILSIREATKKS